MLHSFCCSFTPFRREAQLSLASAQREFIGPQNQNVLAFSATFRRSWIQAYPQEPLWSSHVLSPACFPRLFSFCLSLFLPTSVCLTPSSPSCPLLSLLLFCLPLLSLSVPYIHLLMPPSAGEQKKRTKDNKALMQMDTPGLSKSKTSQHSRLFHLLFPTGFLSCVSARVTSSRCLEQGQAYGYCSSKDVTLGLGEVRVGRGRGQGQGWVKAGEWLQRGGLFGAVNSRSSRAE